MFGPKTLDSGAEIDDDGQLTKVLPLERDLNGFGDDRGPACNLHIAQRENATSIHAVQCDLDPVVVTVFGALERLVCSANLIAEEKG